MDVSVSGGAGGGMFGQVPVGMAGGSPGGGAMPGFDSAMSKLAKQAGAKPTIDSLPDKVLRKIFSYLSHREILKYAVICKKWHIVSQDSGLWGFVSLRPEISGLYVDGESHMQQLIPTKFGANLRYLEMNAELVTLNVLQDLAKKCPNLTHMLLDFAQASQLHDFTDLSQFPTKLKFMALYLSDTIFLDNFMKRIYSFINGLEMLHINGTYEKAEMEEGEVYEVVNIKTLKQATPNLRIINLYGISFIDDTHIEAFSSNCIQLQVLCVNYCSRVTGSSLKILLQRCRNLKCLMLQQTSLQNEHVMAAEWEKADNLQELDISATDLSKECLMDVLPRIPALQWLSAGQLDGMTDAVFKHWVDNANLKELISLDVDASDNLTEEALFNFINVYGPQLKGLALSGMPHVTDGLWNSIFSKLKQARILVMGTTDRMSAKIHVDHLVDAMSKNCPHLERLEFRWDNDTLRFSDKNQKAIDMLRTKCLKLKSLVLCDGRLYEIMRGNFERADRRSAIRTGVNCRVSTHYLLTHYEELLFT